MGLSTGLSPSSWLEEIPAAFESSDYVPLGFTYWVGGLTVEPLPGLTIGMVSPYRASPYQSSPYR